MEWDVQLSDNFVAKLESIVLGIEEFFERVQLWHARIDGDHEFYCIRREKEKKKTKKVRA